MGLIILDFPREWQCTRTSHSSLPLKCFYPHRTGKPLVSNSVRMQSHFFPGPEPSSWLSRLQSTAMYHRPSAAMGFSDPRVQSMSLLVVVLRHEFKMWASPLKWSLDWWVNFYDRQLLHPNTALMFSTWPSTTWLKSISLIKKLIREINEEKANCYCWWIKCRNPKRPKKVVDLRQQ